MHIYLCYVPHTNFLHPLESVCNFIICPNPQSGCCTSSHNGDSVTATNSIL